MYQAARQATRVHRELQMMQSDPPPGAWVWPLGDTLSRLQAQIQGPDDTVYANGMFILDIQIPERYPFEPPSVRFKTPIYHPNIDNGGRICLDLLNMPPKGSWKPSLNISTLLTSIRLLLSEPNADDGLMTDITAEYKHSRSSFDAKARQWTEQYAVRGCGHPCKNDQAPAVPDLKDEEKDAIKTKPACSLRPSTKLSVTRQKRLSEEAETPSGSADIPVTVISDSGSEDDEPSSSRASLTQKSLALKRKKGARSPRSS